MLAGADYVQIYSQFIYQGPAIVSDIVKGLKAKVQSEGFDDLATALEVLRKKNNNWKFRWARNRHPETGM